jgi:uracil phosphoribosyltransferase
MTESIENYCTLIDHPVILDKLTQMRARQTDPDHFRRLLEEISLLMAYEVTKDLPTRNVTVETPIDVASGVRVAQFPVLVAILRAGLGMLNGMSRLLGEASVGHLGMYRDKESQQVIEYYCRMPDHMQGRSVLLLDPLLATGETALKAVERLKQFNVGAIRLVTILASSPGLARLYETYPDIQVYSLSIEPELDGYGYIVPGIGDAGDRLFATVGAPAPISGGEN